MANLERGPERSGEAKGSATFEKDLAKLEFNEQVVADEMFDNLSKANYNGYTLIRGEILGKRNPGSEVITRDQFDEYVSKQGGRKFLERIFLRGKVALSKDFERLKAQFEQHKMTVADHDFQKAHGLADDDLMMTRKEMNMAKSGFADKVRKAARSLAVDVDKLTFEQAFDSGVVFGEHFSASSKGAAEYGLSWFEYRNRSERMTKLKRAEMSKKPAKKLEEDDVSDEDLFSKRERPVVSLGKKGEELAPSVGLLGKPVGVEEKEIPKSLEKCKIELAGMIQDKLADAVVAEMIKPDSGDVNFSMELARDGKSLQVIFTNLKKAIFTVSILKTLKSNDFAFWVRGKLFYDPQEVINKGVEKISAEVVKYKESIRLDAERIDREESQAWQKVVSEYMDGLEEEYSKSPVEIEGKPFYFRKQEEGKYLVIIKGHENYTVKLDSAKRIITVSGEIRTFLEGDTQIYKDQAIASWKGDKEDKVGIKKLLENIPKYRDEKKVQLTHKFMKSIIKREPGEK